MYYRRKLLLSLLASFGGSLDKIVLQHLLLLVSKSQVKPDYHFVPSSNGSLSYQANADLKALTTYGNVIELNDEWVLVDNINYNSLLHQQDKLVLMRLKQQFKDKLSLHELWKYVYGKYPYYAIFCKEAQKVLTLDEQQNVLASIPQKDEQALYTIGYEGISLEQYMNRLIKHDVKVLCDVRSNAFSQKFGFSKKQLQLACSEANIQYYHIPELGIKSDKRQALSSQLHYDNLFKTYKKEVLSCTVGFQDNIVDLLSKNNRVAITCFEANIHQCHRLHLAEAIAELPSWQYQLQHI